MPGRIECGVYVLAVEKFNYPKETLSVLAMKWVENVANNEELGSLIKGEEFRNAIVNMFVYVLVMRENEK